MTSAFYGGRDPRTVAAYTVGDVAAYLQLPRGTVRNWVLGMTYRSGGKPKKFLPVIRVADARAKLLSFENLVEVHVLSSLRREHEVSLDAVRHAVRYLEKKFDSAHPLADVETLTDRVSVFVEEYGRLTNASADGQQALRAVVSDYLRRVDRDPSGRSTRLYPVTRTGVPIGSAPRAVAIDPTIRFGHPFLVACGVETRVIAGRVKAGDSVPDLARDFEVSEEAIVEAIRYELPAAA